MHEEIPCPLQAFLYTPSTGLQDGNYAAHSEFNTYQMSNGTLITSFGGAYGSGVFGNNVDGGTSYVLEGAFDLGYRSLYSGGPIALHWTME